MSALYAFLDYLNPFVERTTGRLKPGDRIKFILYTSFIYEACRRGLRQEESYNRAHNQRKKIYSKDKLENVTPPKHIYMRIYHILSTITHIVCISWTMVMLSFSQSDPRRRWLRCHLPQFVFYEKMDQEHMIMFANLFGLTTMSWRLVCSIGFDLKVHGLPFMMLGKDIIEAESDPRLAEKDYLDSELSLIHNILFYRIEDRSNSKILFRLRPSRTPAARAILDELSKWGLFIILSITATAAVTLLPVCARTVIFYQHTLYKDCETSDSLYWYRLAVCTYYTLILFLDNAISLIAPTASGVFVSFDLLLNWRVIELKIKSLTRQMVDIRFNHQYYEDLDLVKATPPDKYSKDADKKMAVELRARDLKLLLMESHEIQEKVCELQSLMGDFFVQLHQGDRYMSRLLTFGAFLWLGINAFVTISGLQTNPSSVFIVRIAQSLGLFSLSIISVLAFWIKQNTEPAYQRINFLMAMDMSSDKLRWKVLLKYYTVNARHGFTLANSILYTQIIFFKIITYTFSFFTFINNFRNLAK